ncbi:MAG: hypothetical protein GXX85_14390 [Ignavibacteria bacterium]|jgi:hypothetical protein|nr:hypothetical protein [Ignavibacteria bacterium]
MSIKEKFKWFDFSFFSLVLGLITGLIIGLTCYNQLVKDDELKPTKHTFELIRTPVGFDVYKNDSLLFEFTKQNTDSLSLETLKDIWRGENNE